MESFDTEYRTRHSIARAAVGGINLINTLIDFDRGLGELAELEGVPSTDSQRYADAGLTLDGFWDALADFEVAVDKLQLAFLDMRVR